MRADNFFHGLLVVGVAALLMGFATRVVDYHMPSFELGAAMGWLNQDDGRSFALKGTYSVNKFGYNANADGGVEESIWDMDDIAGADTGPIRCFANLTTAAPLCISSDNAADAELGVTVELLDANYNLSMVEETLGVAAVTSGTVGTNPLGTGSYLRVNRAYATGDELTGNIYIHKDCTADTGNDGVPDTPATDIVAGITAGENQTLQACYTVPAGFSAALLGWCKSNIRNGGVATAATFRWRKSVEGAASRNQSQISLGNETSQCTDVNPPGLFTEKTDIEITALSTTQAVSGDFGLLLIPNGS